MMSVLLITQFACNKEKGESSARPRTPKEAALDFLRLVVVKKDFKKAYEKYADKSESYKEFSEGTEEIFDEAQKYKIIEEKGRVEIRQFTVALTIVNNQSRVIYMLAGIYVGGQQVEVGTTPFADIDE